MGEIADRIRRRVEELLQAAAPPSDMGASSLG